MTAPVSNRPSSGPEPTASCGETAPVCGPEPTSSPSAPASTSAATAKRTTEASRVNVEKAKEEVALADKELRIGELALRNQVSGLQPGDVMHGGVEVGGEIRLKFESKTTASVERQDDGTYVVELRGGSRVGLGAGAAVTAGAELGTRFHLQTSAGVADLLQAAAESGLSGVVAAGSPLPLPRVGWRSAETLAGHAQRNMEAATVTLSAKTGFDLENDVAGALGMKVGASLTGSMGAEVDWERGEIKFHQALSADAVARIRGLPVVNIVNIGGDVEVSAGVEGTLTLTEKMKADLKAGRVTLDELSKLATLSFKLELDRSAGLETAAGGLATRVKAEVEVPLSELGKLVTGGEAEQQDVLSRVTASASVYTREALESWSLGGSVKGNGAEVEFRIDRRKAHVSTNALEVKAWLSSELQRLTTEERGTQNAVDAARARARMGT